jgi:phage shock protein A
MAQQSLLGRIAQLARANINSLIDAAEDPQKMLDQMVRDYTEAIREAEASVAQTIGDLRLLEDDHAEAVGTAREWGSKAAAASRKADQLRAAGNATEGDRFDHLAKVALQRQIGAEQQAKGFEPQIASRTEVVDRLKTGLEGMRTKLSDLKAKRDDLVSRARMAEAQSRMHDAVGAIDLLDPTSEVSRFEDKVRREEARVRGQEELAASSLDAQFEALDDDGDDTEVELRLAALKAGTSTT